MCLVRPHVSVSEARTPVMSSPLWGRTRVTVRDHLCVLLWVRDWRLSHLTTLKGDFFAHIIQTLWSMCQCQCTCSLSYGGGGGGALCSVTGFCMDVWCRAVARVLEILKPDPTKELATTESRRYFLFLFVPSFYSFICLSNNLDFKCCFKALCTLVGYNSGRKTLNPLSYLNLISQVSP